MSSVNKAILIGFLGKNPEVKTVQSGNKVAAFTLATSESFVDKNGEKVDKTEWHNVYFWGKTADVVEKYLKKGSKIYLEGKIKTRSFEQDGTKRYITEIEGQALTMLDSKNSEQATEKVEQPVSQTSNNLPF